MMAAQHVRIVEVGPRDGLQSEAVTVSVANRIRLIDALSDCGLSTIEVGSFVSPRHVPQMDGTGEVFAGIRRKPGTSYPVLVPNVMGMTKAIEAGVEEVAVFLSATESFSQRNINCSIEKSLERASEVVGLALSHQIRVRAYVSCTLGCPYEGEVALGSVVCLAERLTGMGCYEISLSDTIGVGQPEQAREMVQAVALSVGVEKLAVHFHDTFGRALENVLACLDAGISVVDSAIGGLGGCPFAPGSKGNFATERLVAMLNGMGVITGVDFGKLTELVETMSKMLTTPHIVLGDNGNVGLASASGY
jgi:hydroxymethylglutaryl-CoA lyase